MSHANGQIRFMSDGKIFHFEYNGTVDTCIPILYTTFDEMHRNWRRTDLKNEDYYCMNKDHKWEDVEIATSYGRGFYWKGKACRECKLIIKNNACDYDSEVSGLPSWWES
jgi:hypothetical protein